MTTTAIPVSDDNAMPNEFTRPLAQETHPVETPKGPVTIPTDPQRVVATYSTDVDFLLWPTSANQRTIRANS